MNGIESSYETISGLDPYTQRARTMSFGIHSLRRFLI